jgi:hypothetical protein
VHESARDVMAVVRQAAKHLLIFALIAVIILSAISVYAVFALPTQPQTPRPQFRVLIVNTSRQSQSVVMWIGVSAHTGGGARFDRYTPQSRWYAQYTIRPGSWIEVIGSDSGVNPRPLREKAGAAVIPRTSFTSMPLFLADDFTSGTGIPGALPPTFDFYTGHQIVDFVNNASPPQMTASTVTKQQYDQRAANPNNLPRPNPNP